MGVAGGGGDGRGSGWGWGSSGGLRPRWWNRSKGTVGRPNHRLPAPGAPALPSPGPHNFHLLQSRRRLNLRPLANRHSPWPPPPPSTCARSAPYLHSGLRRDIPLRPLWGTTSSKLRHRLRRPAVMGLHRPVATVLRRPAATGLHPLTSMCRLRHHAATGLHHHTIRGHLHRPGDTDLHHRRTRRRLRRHAATGLHHRRIRRRPRPTATALRPRSSTLLRRRLLLNLWRGRGS